MEILNFLKAVSDRFKDYAFEDDFYELYKNSDINSFFKNGLYYYPKEDGCFCNPIHYFDDKLNEVDKNNDHIRYKFVVSKEILQDDLINYQLYFQNGIVYTDTDVLMMMIDDYKLNNIIRAIIKRIEFNLFKLKDYLTNVEDILKGTQYIDSEYYKSDDIYKISICYKSSVSMFPGTEDFLKVDWPAIKKKYNIKLEQIQYAVINKYIYLIYYKPEINGFIDIYINKAPFEIHEIDLMQSYGYNKFVDHYNKIYEKLISSIPYTIDSRFFDFEH